MAYSFLYRQRHRRVHRFPSHVSHWNGKERVTDEIGLFAAIYSQRQFTRYKAEPVPREALDKIIDAATKAPNGGNTQPWEFIVLTDREIVTKVGELYQYGNRV